MKLKTKKIIAREFLFLLALLLIVIITYFSALNYYTGKTEEGYSTRTSDVENATYGITFLSIVLLFIIRYLFYAIRWSIKTLKQKAD